MRRKTLLSLGLSLGLALGLTMGLAVGAAAQTVEPELPVVAQVAAATATISQTVPITLELAIPGPAGVITVSVPVLLTLDIRIGLSQTLTPALVLTPSIATVTGPVTTTVTTPNVQVTPTPTPRPTSTPLPAPTATPTTAPAALPTPTPSPEPVVEEPICPDPRAVIMRPGVNQTVSGAFEVTGTASHRDFDYYKLEYAPGAGIDPSTGGFAFLADGRTAVVEGTLAVIDTTALANGVYTLMLTVVDATGNFPPPCTVTFNVEN